MKGWFGWYILEGHTPVPCRDLFTWGRWMEKEKNRVVARTTKGEVVISTVFLGLDHSFHSSGHPVLFETMIFGGGRPYDGHQERYHTWEEAEAGHKKLCRWALGPELKVVNGGKK